jgi:protein involved in polysaccharide export with SLBB domain
MPTQQSEFEAYVSGLAGVPIQRLGSDLMLPARGAAMEANRQVPADYIVGLGDEIQLTIWGSVDADLRLTALSCLASGRSSWLVCDMRT